MQVLEEREEYDNPTLRPDDHGHWNAPGPGRIIPCTTDDVVSHDIPIERIDAVDAAEAALFRQRLEHSLQMLESMQSTFRRGRQAMEPYLDSAYAAFHRLESVDATVVADDEERRRILDTCEAMEKLMRMFEKSRGCVESTANHRH